MGGRSSSRSRRVSVWRVSVQGVSVSVQGVSVKGSLFRGSRFKGSLSRCLYQWRSLSREVSVWFSVQGDLCARGSLPREISVWGFLSSGSLSVQGGLYPRWGMGLCLGGLCPGDGSLSRGGSLCRGRVSVQGVGLHPGDGSLSRGSLSRRGVSVMEIPIW